MRLFMIVTLVLQATAGHKLSEPQILEAIELGRSGQIPTVQAGTFLFVTKGAFSVFIEGPVARIAAAASKAFKQLRPFDVKSVTDDMKAPIYRVFIERAAGTGDRPITVQHIVLQPRRAKGMDGVVQPIKESGDIREAYFDRFPDGEFDVVVVTDVGNQKYAVSTKDRAKIR